MFSVSCKFCAFINNTITCIDYVYAYMRAILVCTKYQRTLHVYAGILLRTRKNMRANFQT